MMEYCNYKKLKSWSLLYSQYVFVDVPEHAADRLFIDEKIKVSFGNEMEHPEYPYRIVFCKVRKKNRLKFISALKGLPDKIMLLGYKDYDEFCNYFIQKYISND